MLCDFGRKRIIVLLTTERVRQAYVACGTLSGGAHHGDDVC